MTIASAHEGLEKKAFSCRELIDAHFGEIVKFDSQLHAFLLLFEKTAREEADRIDAKRARGEKIGLLEGIPLAVKDNILIGGTITTAGSKILEKYTATYDATVISKLKERGSIILGKTNLDEFAMGGSTENSAFGPSRNPYDSTRVPGGSSGGSAVAVAANFCLGALGSDTGGSIRQPAGFCGVVGLKPTYGSVSRSGLMSMASSFDQVGTLAKTVQDAGLLFDAIRGADPHDASSQGAKGTASLTHVRDGVKGVRIGVPKEYFIDGMEGDVEQNVRDAMSVLEGRGAKIIPISLPHTSYALAVYYIIVPAEISANFARYDGIRYGMSKKDAQTLFETYRESRGAWLGDEVRRRILLGTYVLASGYYDAYYKQAQKVRVLIRQDFDRAWQEVDCIATPTSPTAPWRVGEKGDDPVQMYLEDIFTVPASIAGVPGLSIPCGIVRRDGVQLPIGLQLLGKHFDEATLLRVGRAYEEAVR